MVLSHPTLLEKIDGSHALLPLFVEFLILPTSCPTVFVLTSGHFDNLNPRNPGSWRQLPSDCGFCSHGVRAVTMYDTRTFAALSREVGGSKGRKRGGGLGSVV
jgi:hypothetical protein